MAVVDEASRDGIPSDVGLALAAGRDPIAEVVPLGHANADADVMLDELVFGFGIGEGEPITDEVVVGLEDAPVAVLEIDVPWEGDNEATPHGATAALVG